MRLQQLRAENSSLCFNKARGLGFQLFHFLSLPLALLVSPVYLRHLSYLLTSCFKFRKTWFKQVPLFQTDYRKLNTITASIEEL